LLCTAGKGKGASYKGKGMGMMGGGMYKGEYFEWPLVYTRFTRLTYHASLQEKEKERVLNTAKKCVRPTVAALT
jgi:hypothetical protein